MSLTFPSVGVKKLQWLSTGAQYHQKNPLADGGRVFDWGGWVRKAQLTIAALDPGEHEVLTAFILRAGVQNSFTYTDEWLQDFRGDTSSIVTVTSKDPSGFNTSGWPEASVIAYGGDYVSIEGRLYILTEDVSSDESGTAYLPVSPRAITSVESGAEVKRGASVTGTFRLASVVLPEVVSPLRSQGVTLNVVEVL